MKYLKKPVLVEATQWFKNGDHPKDYTQPAIGAAATCVATYTPEYRKAHNWEGAVVRRYQTPDQRLPCKYCKNIMHDHGWIETLEGGHIVCPGDWIITGVKNEMYPCKPDVFELTYEVAREPSPTKPAVTPQYVIALQTEPERVSNEKFNRLRDDYFELLSKSKLDSRDAKKWRDHVNCCQARAVDLDHKC